MSNDETDQDPIRVELSSKLTNAEAEALAEKLKASLKARRRTVIRAGQVEKVSTAGIQVLLAAARDLPGVEIVDPSPALIEAADDLGVIQHLNERFVVQ